MKKLRVKIIDMYIATLVYKILGISLNLVICKDRKKYLLKL